MAKVFINRKFENAKGKIWEAQNGATRRTLVLIVNEKDFPNGINIQKNTPITARVGYLDKGNHSFIFINKSDKPTSTLGIFLNSAYGYTVLNPETEIYSNSSVGGYGNSESKFGIYKSGAIIQEHTYKNRTPNDYYILTESGWKYLGHKDDIMEKVDLDDNCRKVAELKGWIQEIEYIE